MVPSDSSVISEREDRSDVTIDAMKANCMGEILHNSQRLPSIKRWRRYNPFTAVAVVSPSSNCHRVGDVPPEDPLFGIPI